MVNEKFGCEMRSRRGFSLVEVLISTLLMVVLIIPAISVFGLVGKSYSSRASVSRAHGVAQNILTTISQLDFSEPDDTPVFGPEPDETSINEFDDVDDFHDEVFEADGFTVSTSIQYVQVLNPELEIPTASSLKRIRVEISGGSLLTPVTLFGLRSDNGVVNHRPEFETTVTNRVDLSVGVGGSPPLSTAVGVLNRIPHAPAVDGGSGGGSGGGGNLPLDDSLPVEGGQSGPL